MDVSTHATASEHSEDLIPHIITAWSAPSAIGTAGVGVGGQAGAEVTDFLIVLNSRAVRLFKYSPADIPFN